MGRTVSGGHKCVQNCSGASDIPAQRICDDDAGSPVFINARTNNHMSQHLAESGQVLKGRMGHTVSGGHNKCVQNCSVASDIPAQRICEDDAGSPVSRNARTNNHMSQHLAESGQVLKERMGRTVSGDHKCVQNCSVASDLRCLGSRV